ncbi:hypothetical protein [Halorussus halophilus]|uniref:hypothetical protein n=1 Tax=Halorussus halophilus TaxID=2650975 RepID=UPI0013013F5E|nr:hypothetical protein [Halorussus halophilus]
MRDDVATFSEMFTAYPFRTALASFGPVMFGTAQLLNGYVNDVPITRAGLFTVVMVAAAVLVTQYHLVEFRKTRLRRRFGFSDD